jgi:hypothetical protein
MRDGQRIITRQLSDGIIVVFDGPQAPQRVVNPVAVENCEYSHRIIVGAGFA